MNFILILFPMGIALYGTPVISYDTGKLAISVTDVINDRLFKATAKDSFDAPIDVSVELENGTIAGGNVVTFRLSAVDALGNMCSVVTDRIKVYSADDIELVYNKAASTRIRKISHGEEFEAVATNSFGEACAISIVAADGYVLEGGNIINLYIVATDALGNFVQSELITGIRVYDMPTLSFAREYGYIQKSDSPYALFSLHDSFGTEVTTTITVVSGSLDDETVTYKITGTDRAGNSFEQDYELVVLDTDESILELYKNGEKIGTQRVTKGESFSLPCNIGYYTVWYLNGVAITDNMGSSLSAWANDSNGYIVTAIPVPITYSIQYDMGGGTNSSFNPSAYNIENSTITLSHPTRTGYTFIGWTGTGLAEREMNVVISAGSYGDRTYTAHWQANSYTVSLDANGGEVSVDTLQVTYDATYNLPVPSRTGYTFAGWFADEILYSGGIWRVADDVELIASWTPNTDTVYTVNHYWQNITDDEYTLYETETLRGTTDTSVTPSTEMYTGFTAPQAQTVNVDPDGSRIVNYYYTRNYYTVTVVGNGGTNNTITQKYQSVIDTTNWTTRDGYTLGGLYTDLSLTTLYTDKTMPAENKTVYAYWTGENVASDFEYTSGTNGITITGYTGISTIVKIPEQIGGRDVVAIAASAFANQTNLTSVVVPDSVESIGLGAFKGCDSLESISLPFVGASRDAEVYNGVFGYIFGYEIKYNSEYSSSTAYGQSSYSTEFVNSKYTSEPTGTTWQYTCYNTNVSSYSSSYRYRKTSYYYYIPTTLTSVVITDATVIPVAAFNGCANITSVVLNDKVETIEEYAFQNCTGLVSADIGTGLTEIGTYAFYNCTSLESIVVPSGVTTISSYAFYNNTALASVSLPSGMTAINSYAFYNTTGLKELVFPSELQSIGSYAFYGTRIRELNIPGEVTSIGSHAFDGDVALTSLTIPGNVTSIGSYAFSGCENITTLTLESGIETIGDYAFQNLKVTSVVVPDSVESIGVGAFKGCDSLESISLPFVGASRDAEAYNGVFGYIFGYTTKVRNYNNYGYLDGTEYKSASSTEYVNTQYSSVSGATWQYSAYDCYDYRSSTIKAYVLRSYFYYIPTTLTSVVITDATVIPVAAFNGCANITSVVLNDKVETIEEYAFQNCTGLVSADIGTGLTEIGTYAFYNCTSLESIVVPSGVTTISSYAFYNNTALASVSLPSGMTAINSYAFYNTTGLKELVFPSELQSIGSYAFYGTRIRELNIPGEVTSIGSHAFDGDVALTSLTIPGNVTSIGSYAFSGCENITTLTLESGIETIGDYAFQNLKVTSVVVPDSVESIGVGAFKGCDSLESISLPFVGASRDAEAYNGVFGYIFGYTTKVRNYNNYGYLDGTEYKSASSTEYVNTQYSSVSGATWQYSAYDCYDYRSSTIKAYVLRSYFYYIPTTLTSVVITDATVIPVAAFNGCTNITSVVLNDEVETIEKYAFQNCTGLVSADIGVGLTEIGTYAFYNCTSLESIVVPYGVNTMESYVFANCSSLSIKCQIEEQPSDWSSTWNSSSRPVEWEYGCERGVTADGVAWISIDGVTVRIIGYSGSASTLTIPTMIDGKVVNRIAAGAFDGNSTLVSIIIPEGILYIESDAFANITTLTTVTIADSVVEIADGAFSGCVNTSFLCEVAAKPTGWSASWKNSNCAIVWDYAGVNGSTEDGFLWAQLSDGNIIIYGYVGSNGVITIPTSIDGKNITTISENAFRGNTEIISVFIPKCIEVIGANAFTGCSNLTINCEIASQPSGWASTWKDSGTTVYWSM